MGKKTNRDIHDKVIEFKYRHKNTYHWDYEDDLDGLLEQTKPHETDPIPADFPAVKFDADETDGPSTYKEVENYNNMVAGSIANVGIVYHNPSTDGMEGTALPPLAADADNDSIKEVYMPEMILRK